MKTPTGRLREEIVRAARELEQIDPNFHFDFSENRLNRGKEEAA